MQRKSPLFWTIKENQRKFLDELGRKLNVKNPIDWGLISVNTVKKNKGSRLMSHYGGSLFKTLVSTYPGFYFSRINFAKEINWKKEWFPCSPNYWTNANNQRRFLNDFEKINNIKIHSDWGKISSLLFRKLGGAGLLKQYNGCMYKMLSSVYPEISWKTKWFKRMFLNGRNFFKSTSNQRVFLEQIASKYQIQEPAHWLRISKQIIQEQGGKGFLFQYNGKLNLALNTIYPDTNFNSFSSFNFQTQNQLNLKLNSLFFALK